MGTCNAFQLSVTVLYIKNKDQLAENKSKEVTVIDIVFIHQNYYCIGEFRNK